MKALVGAFNQEKVVKPIEHYTALLNIQAASGQLLVFTAASDQSPLFVILSSPPVTSSCLVSHYTRLDTCPATD